MSYTQNMTFNSLFSSKKSSEKGGVNDFFSNNLYDVLSKNATFS